MEHTQYERKSRAKRIQEARESCCQQKVNKKQDVTYHYTYHNEGMQKHKSTQMSQSKGVKKMTFVRFFVASTLFLSLFALNHFESSIPIDVSQIQTFIRKNTIVENLELKAAHYIEEKILPVFHRLEE